jgi:hypothetical protein
MSDTPRTDAASVSRGFIEREMDYYSHQFVLAGNMRDLELELAAAEAEIERLRVALEYAVRQNEHDMLLTGEECRAARTALKEPK